MAGPQVGIEGLSAARGVLPVGVDAVETIFEPHLLRHSQRRCGVVELQRSREFRQLRGIRRGAWQTLAVVHDADDGDLWGHLVARDVLRVDPEEAVGRVEPELAVGVRRRAGQRAQCLRHALHAGEDAERLRLQSARRISNESGHFIGRNAHNARRGIEPHLARGTAHDARDAAQRFALHCRHRMEPCAVEQRQACGAADPGAAGGWQERQHAADRGAVVSAEHPRTLALHDRDVATRIADPDTAARRVGLEHQRRATDQASDAAVALPRPVVPAEDAARRLRDPEVAAYVLGHGLNDEGAVGRR